MRRSFKSREPGRTSRSGSVRRRGSTTTAEKVDAEASTSYAREVFARDSRGVILYDGVCNMCNAAVNFAVTYDKDETSTRGSVRFAALQSDAGRALLRAAGRAEDDISSIVYVKGEREAYVKSKAVLEIAKEMRAPFPVLAMVGGIVPVVIGDALYDFVAKNRYSFLGKRDECRLGDEAFDERFLR